MHDAAERIRLAKRIKRLFPHLSLFTIYQMALAIQDRKSKR